MAVQASPKKKQTTRSRKPKTSSPTRYKEIAEAAKENAKKHGQSARTNTVYAAYIGRGRAWIASFRDNSKGKLARCVRSGTDCF